MAVPGTPSTSDLQASVAAGAAAAASATAPLASILVYPTDMGCPDSSQPFVAAATLASGMTIWTLASNPAAGNASITPVVYSVAVAYNDMQPPALPAGLTWTQLDFPLVSPDPDTVAAHNAALASSQAGRVAPPPRSVYLYYAAAAPAALPPATATALSPVVALKVVTDVDTTVGAGFVRLQNQINPDAGARVLKEQLCYKTVAGAARATGPRQWAVGDSVDCRDHTSRLWRWGRIGSIDYDTASATVFFDAHPMKFDTTVPLTELAEARIHTKGADMGALAELASFDTKAESGIPTVTGNATELISAYDHAVQSAATTRASIAPGLDKTALLTRFTAPLPPAPLQLMHNTCFRNLHYQLTWNTANVIKNVSTEPVSRVMDAVAASVDVLISSLAFTPVLPEDHAVWLLRALGGDGRFSRIFACEFGPSVGAVSRLAELLAAPDAPHPPVRAVADPAMADSALLNADQYRDLSSAVLPYRFAAPDATAECLSALHLRVANANAPPRRADYALYLIDRFCARGGLSVLQSRLHLGRAVTGYSPSGASASAAAAGDGAPAKDNIYTFMALVRLAVHLKACLVPAVWDAMFADRLNFGDVLLTRIQSMTDAEVKLIDSRTLINFIGLATPLLQDDQARYLAALVSAVTAEAARYSELSDAAAIVTSAAVGVDPSSVSAVREALDSVRTVLEDLPHDVQAQVATLADAALAQPFKLAFILRLIMTHGVLDRRIEGVTLLVRVCATVAPTLNLLPPLPAAPPAYGQIYGYGGNSGRSDLQRERDDQIAEDGRDWAALTASALAQWIDDAGIFPALAGQHRHGRMISAAGPVVAFLAAQRKLTDEQIHALWQCVTATGSVSTAALDALDKPFELSGSGGVDGRIVDYLVSEVAKVQPKDITPPMLSLISKASTYAFMQDTALLPAAEAAAAAAPLAGDAETEGKLNRAAADAAVTSSLSSNASSTSGNNSESLHLYGLDFLWRLVTDTSVSRNIRTTALQKFKDVLTKPELLPLQNVFAHRALVYLAALARDGYGAAAAAHFDRARAQSEVAEACVDIVCLSQPTVETPLLRLAARLPTSLAAPAAVAAAHAAANGPQADPPTALLWLSATATVHGSSETWPRTLELAAADAALEVEAENAASLAQAELAAAAGAAGAPPVKVKTSFVDRDRLCKHWVRRLALDAKALSQGSCGSDASTTTATATATEEDDSESNALVQLLLGELSQNLAWIRGFYFSNNNGDGRSPADAAAAAAATSATALTRSASEASNGSNNTVDRSRATATAVISASLNKRLNFLQRHILNAGHTRLTFRNLMTLWNALVNPAWPIPEPSQRFFDLLYSYLPYKEVTATSPTNAGTVAVSAAVLAATTITEETACRVFAEWAKALFAPVWCVSVYKTFELLFLIANKNAFYLSEPQHVVGRAFSPHPRIVGFVTVTDAAALRDVELFWRIIADLPALADNDDAADTVVRNACMALLLLHTRTDAALASTKIGRAHV